MYGENAHQVRESVKSDLKNNVRILRPDRFCKTFLDFDFSQPLPDIFEKVQNEFYSDGRWKDIPKSNEMKEAPEINFYKLFVDIAQAVNTACWEHAPRDVKSVWVDRHSTALGTLSKDASEIRPNIIQVSESTYSKFEALNNDLSVAEDDDEKEKMASAWWMQIHTIVEVKPAGAKDIKELHETIVQLCSYIRQLLREQFDRRFTIALLLCRDELTLWFCDRIGLVGTIEPINIHERPDIFLKILAAFSTLPTHRLGWDPTMKLYVNDRSEPVPSYTVFQNCHPYTLKWCISMPSKEDPNQREEFVTIRTLVTAFSQRICGRASLVWEAITKEDFRTGQIRKVFVLKQAWQPVKSDEAFDGVSEAAMYEIAQLREDRIYSYERVKTEKKEVVSTQFFRGDWKLETYEQAVERLESDFDNCSGPTNKKTGQKRTFSNTGIRSEAEEPFSYIRLLEVNDNIFYVDNDNISLHPRALIRLLMDKCGYPLKYFVDNLELVTALRDAVRDHEIMYENGILHRDISFGNILICDVDDEDEMKDAGMLIDLDHAKYSAERIITPSHTYKWEDGENLLLRLFLEEQTSKLEPDSDVLSKTLKVFRVMTDASHYLREVFGTLPECLRNDNETSTALTANELYWPDKIKQEIPDFSSLKAREELKLTGTIPFISINLMWLTAPWTLITSGSCPIHDAIHDMESIFWVLLYICLTREANKDGIRRRELQPNSAEKNKRLLNLVCDLFDKGTTQTRINCLEDPAALEDILKSVHPYFERLKPLLSKLRWVLHLAHKYKGVEHYNIHSIVLAILEDTIAELKEHRNDQEILEAKKNRRKQWTKWRAVRQVPDVDEESDRPSNIGGYSPFSDSTDANPPLNAIPNKPLAPIIPPPKSKKRKEDPAQPVRRQRS